jgi:hypothetical protein
MAEQATHRGGSTMSSAAEVRVPEGQESQRRDRKSKDEQVTSRCSGHRLG